MATGEQVISDGSVPARGRNRAMLLIRMDWGGKMKREQLTVHPFGAVTTPFSSSSPRKKEGPRHLSFLIYTVHTRRRHPDEGLSDPRRAPLGRGGMKTQTQFWMAGSKTFQVNCKICMIINRVLIRVFLSFFDTSAENNGHLFFSC